MRHWERIGITLIGLVLAGLGVVRSTHAGDGGVLLFALLAVQAGAVLARRRGPLAAWAVCLACCCAVPTTHSVWAVSGGLAQLTLLHLALRAPRRIVVGAAVVTWAALWIVHSRQPGFAVFGVDGAVMVLWTASAAAIGLAVRNHLDYIAATEERARWALETRTAEGRRLVAEERLRIARELHDVLGHHVAVIRVHAGLARRTLTTAPAKAAAALTETEAAAQAVLREMSGILRLLREDERDEPASPAPGLADLDLLIETVRRGGFDVTVEREIDDVRVTDLTAVTAYRVVQECLTNARRHATGPLRVTLRTDESTLTIIADNPAAGESTEGGFGLIGMGERVRAVGGRLRVDRSGGRFLVTADLPLDVGADLARKDA